jgi:hypothetical protein
MAKPKFDRDRAARVIAMAAAVGDEEAAKAAGISTRTIERWRARVATDKELSAVVAEKHDQVQKHLDGTFRSFMRGAVGKLGQLVSQAGVEDIHAVAGAVKIVGDLMNFRDGLGVSENEEKAGEDGGQPSGNGASQPPTEDARVVPLRGVKGIRTQG